MTTIASKKKVVKKASSKKTTAKKQSARKKTAFKKKSSKKKFAKKASSKKSSKKKVVKKAAFKKKVAKKASSKKSSKKKVARKKTTPRTTRYSLAQLAGKTPMSVASAEVHHINGIVVVTEDGKKPSKRSAQGYVEGARIKTSKLFQDVRSGGVGDINELTRSIRADGILEPLIVRPLGDSKNFELVAGERRLKAAKVVGSRVWGHIPIIIRPDLQGNDDKAIAVAVAENSPDGRSNLNIIDIGRQVLRLQKKKWTPDRIAKEMGLHPKKVRRSLDLQDVSAVIQEKVRSGEFSARAAVELHKLPTKVQKAMESEVGPHTSAADIRTIRKRMERDAVKQDTTLGSGKDATKTGGGKPSERAAISWRPPSEKKLQIGTLSYSLHSAKGDEVGNIEYHELRGALGYALWGRGDLDSPLLPPVNEEQMENPQVEKKINAIFNTIVGNESARHEARASESE